MEREIKRWGPDGISIVSSDAAVFGFASLAVLPESPYEIMPWQDGETGVLFTATARLDNRDQLCDLFGIAAAESATMADGRLVWEAYRRWGVESPGYLYGDWSFAAWNSRSRRLFLARDQLGNTGLHYFSRPPFFAFASDPEGLFALPEIERRIDEKYVASHLVIFGLGDADDTCWVNVKQLLSGSALIADSEGKQVRQYWEMKEVSPDIGRKDDEYVAGFLDHYRAAVKTRLRSCRPIGTTLSAGLDSGSVTALAAQALKEEGKTLTAFTSVPQYPASHLVPGALADEWPLAHAVANCFDNLEHLAIDAATVSPLTGIERAVAIAHSPQHAAVNEFWIMALHDAARERGIGAMLTGQLGNGGVSWSGGINRIFFLFADGRWDEGMKAMREWKRHTGRSWIRTVAGRLIRPIIQPGLTHFQNILKGTPLPWADYAAIHPAFAQRMEVLQAMRKAGRGKPFDMPIRPFEERRLTMVRNGSMAGPLWHVTGAAFGMEVRDPTADIRLLEYCLSVPHEQDIYSGGQRMLIRRAMAGILPEEVRWNTIRGKQAADVAFRILQHPVEMETTLARLNAHPEVPRYLDLPLMRHVWQDIQATVTRRTAQRAGTILLRGIMSGCFIEDACRLKHKVITSNE